MSELRGTIPPGVLNNPVLAQQLLNQHNILGAGSNNDAMLYQEPIYQSGANGPFLQTLFLGCSVTNFNVNLGWGAENSSLTVTLVRDDSPHWLDPEFNNNTLLIKNNNIARITNPNNLTPTFDVTTEPIPQTKLLGPGGTANSPAKQDNNVSDFNRNALFGGDQYRDIYLKEELISDTNKELNIFLSNANPSIPDYGKVYYTPLMDGNFEKNFWRGPDPGFVGELYDILGTPVRFIFNGTPASPGRPSTERKGFEFVGLVTSWTKTGGSSSKETYTVQIKSFSSLLSNTQLIVDHYPGTIFTKFEFGEEDYYPPIFNQIQGGFGMPSNNIGNRYGRKDPPNNNEYLNSDYYLNDGANYVGNMSQGNIPNVFNIYGYLEATRGYGKSDVNELGTKVSDILISIKDLVSKTDTDGYTPKRVDKRFSPYGRIIGKAPAVTKTNTINFSPNDDGNVSIDGAPSEDFIGNLFLGDQYSILQPQECLISGIIQVPYDLNAPSRGFREVVYPPTLFEYLPTFNIFKRRSESSDVRLHSMGLLPVFFASDNVPRQQYQLNLDELPSTPSGYRIKGPVISVMQLITQVCEESGHDFFIDFEPSGNQIKLRTISRKQQPPSNYIQKLLYGAAGGSSQLTSFDYGKETNDSATTRAMYIGGKQKRLLQLHSNFLANKNNGLVFDPYDDAGKGSLITHDINKIANIARIPDHYSTRNLNDPFYYSFIYNLASGTGAILWENYSRASWESTENGALFCGHGNYIDPISFNGVNFQASETKGFGVGQHAGNPYGADTSVVDIFTDIGYSMYNAKNYPTTDQDTNDAVGTAYTMPTINVATPDTAQMTTEPSTYYNYPLWDDFISPYFGLDIDGTARKVYYDTGMRQIQVLCSIGDLQNRIGFALTAAINPEIKIEPWQPDPNNVGGGGGGASSPDPGIDNQGGEGSSPSQAGQQELENLSIYNRWTQNMIWGNVRRDYYKFDSKFLVTENEIRAAMASMDSWMEYTFNRNFTTDLGQILRKTIFANTGMVVKSKTAPTADQEDANKRNFGLDYPVVLIHNGPDVFVANHNPSENPTASKQAMFIDKVRDTIEKVYEFVKELGDQHYGRQFMVKIPGLSVSRDAVVPEHSNFFIKLGEGDQKQEFEANYYEGGGKYYSSYKPSTDGAWEEIGNIIDDTLVVGSISGDFFREGDGKIGPILGYKASYEYLKDTIPDKEFVKTTRPADASTLADPKDNRAGKPMTMFFMNSGEFTNYTSRVVDSGLAPGGIPIKDIMTTILLNTPVSPDKSAAATSGPPTAAMIYAQVSQPATGTDIIPNEWYPSLTTQLNNQEYLLYPYNSKKVPVANNIPSFAKQEEMSKSTTGKTVPSTGPDGELNFNEDFSLAHLQYKLYAKAQIEQDYIPINTWEASPTVQALLSLINSSANTRPGGREYRAILTLSAPVLLNPVHLVDKYLPSCLSLDSNLFKKEGCSVPKIVAGKTKKEYALFTDPPVTISEFSGTINGGLLPFSGGFGIGSNILIDATDYFLKAVGLSSEPQENKATTMAIAPRAAMPGFAAVPLESQAAVYGPWTNHPYLIRNDIVTTFNNESISPNTRTSSILNSIENLVGGIKIEVSDELVPWRYGGMRALDAAVIEKIQSDASYQLEIEYGNADIPGAPIYKLGDLLDKGSKLRGGPIINNISANIDSGGVSTKYAFRTYSKKFGLYNKESADRLQRISQESIVRRKELAIRSAQITNQSFQSQKKRNLNNAVSTDFVNRPLSESWRSASELLVGHNEISFRLPDSGIPNGSTTGPNITKLASGLYDQFPYDYSWPYSPVNLIDPSGAGNYDVVKFPKIVGQTKLMDSREADRFFTGDYENTSMMSLDGILSPISYYPTENAKTYHIAKYPREQCRHCLGIGKIKYQTNKSSFGNAFSATSMSELSYNGKDVNKKREEKTIDCPFCEPDSIKASGLLNSSRRGKVIPPYILTNLSDEELSKKNSNNKGNKEGLINIPAGATIINYSTLNPVILPFGEFSAFQNRQSGDYTGHSIKMVAQGTIPPWQPSDSLNNQICGSERLFKSFLEYDQLYLDMVNGIYTKPPEKRTETEQKIIDNIGTQYPRPFRNNSRFFGLRGPLMLHSWGYDTEGYPVPNSSGELKYKIDNQGKFVPVQVTLAENPLKSIYVYKNQRFVPSGAEPAPTDVVWVKNSEGQVGFLTAPYKENTFAKGWAQLPSTWPVGPVDLRWDESARIWTIPTNYRNVYILLEEDLNNNIARGQLIDNNAPNITNPLPLGYRKVVFVRDTLGIYRAPRSAVIYCTYDNGNGYYEPISQSSFTTSGTIISSNTASMYNIYASRASNLANNAGNENSNTSATFVASYSNPLDISVYPGDAALFTYLQNGWVVQAARG